MTTHDTGRAAQIREELGGLAASRLHAERRRAAAMERTVPLVLEAHQLGLGPTELQRLTGLSRRAIYDIIADAAAPQ